MDNKKQIRFLCDNCSISIEMTVDPSRVIEIDGKRVLLKARCWCDKEHGVLVVA